MAQMIDWNLAVSVGTQLAGPGPAVNAAQARAVVDELRSDAALSTPLVREFTGLEAAAGTAPVLVVDRRGWIQANADGFGAILDPLVDRIAQKRGMPSGASLAIGSKVTGAEVGLLLGFMGGKVLGQFDPFFGSPDGPGGRLLLVAPNIVHVERELEVDPTDFRLWVCLHEETHRVQFTAVPWLREHLLGLMHELIDSVEPSELLESGIARISEVLRSRSGSLLEALSTPEQRQTLDRITGVMSLLEGHADVVMDGVGPSVIPSVAAIREKFTKRRKGIGTLDRLLRRLLGLEAKMAQYRDGAEFVRTIVDKVGMTEFNAIWSGPQALPSKAEISDPEAWMSRVLD